MTIEFQCAECGSVLRTADDTAGKRAKCPSCGAVVPIPVPGAPPLQGGNPFAVPPPPVQPTGGAFNPYQSPTADMRDLQYGWGAQALPLVPTRMELGDVLTRTWEIFKANLWLCIGVIVLVVILQQGVGMGISVVAQPIQMALGQEIGIVIFILMNLVSYVFSMWLSLGQLVFLLKLARGTHPQISEIFSGGPFLLRTIGAMLLLYLILGGVVFVCFIPGLLVYLVSQSEEAMFVTMILCAVIPAMVVGLMLTQFQFLIVDRGVGAVESLRLSATIMRGNKLTYFLMGLVLFFIVIAGLFACCVGLLFAVPYIMLATVVAYLTMTGQFTGTMAAPPEPPSTEAPGPL